MIFLVVQNVTPNELHSFFLWTVCIAVPFCHFCYGCCTECFRKCSFNFLRSYSVQTNFHTAAWHVAQLAYLTNCLILSRWTHSVLPELSSVAQITPSSIEGYCMLWSALAPGGNRPVLCFLPHATLFLYLFVHIVCPLTFRLIACFPIHPVCSCLYSGRKCSNFPGFFVCVVGILCSTLIPEYSSLLSSSLTEIPVGQNVRFVARTPRSLSPLHSCTLLQCYSCWIGSFAALLPCRTKIDSIIAMNKNTNAEINEDPSSPWTSGSPGSAGPTNQPTNQPITEQIKDGRSNRVTFSSENDVCTYTKVSCVSRSRRFLQDSNVCVCARTERTMALVDTKGPRCVRREHRTRSNLSHENLRGPHRVCPFASVGHEPAQPSTLQISFILTKSTVLTRTHTHTHTHTHHRQKRTPFSQSSMLVDFLGAKLSSRCCGGF